MGYIGPKKLNLKRHYNCDIIVIQLNLFYFNIAFKPENN